MNVSELKKRFLIIKPLIIEAGNKVKSMRDRGVIQTESKPDGSIVTNADYWANEFLVKSIQNNYPNELVIGEESSDKKYSGNPDSAWFIDPIDGTKAFADGGDDYYVLIGYCYKGIPVLGLHYKPESGELVYGHNGIKPGIMSPQKKAQFLNNKSAYWTNEPRIYLKSNEAILREQAKSFGVKRAKYARGMVDMIAPLFGKADGFVSFRPTHYWDLAAPAAIMRSAGFLSPFDNNVRMKIRFNDGNIRTGFFYSLPPDTPESFIKHLATIHTQRLF